MTDRKLIAASIRDWERQNASRIVLDGWIYTERPLLLGTHSYDAGKFAVVKDREKAIDLFEAGAGIPVDWAEPLVSLQDAVKEHEVEPDTGINNFLYAFRMTPDVTDENWEQLRTLVPVRDHIDPAFALSEPELTRWETEWT